MAPAGALVVGVAAGMCGVRYALAVDEAGDPASTSELSKAGLLVSTVALRLVATTGAVHGLGSGGAEAVTGTVVEVRGVREATDGA